MRTDTAFPRWLLDEIGKRRTLSELIDQGSRLLLEAALLAGGGQRIAAIGGREHARFWPDSMNARLFNLPSRAQLNPVASVPSIERFSVSLSRQIQEALPESQCKTLQAPSIEDVHVFVNGVLGGLSRLAETVAREGRRAPTVVYEMAPERSPFLLLQASYHALASNKTRRSVGQDEGRALALIGLATHSMLTMGQCELCFRWAMPGHRFCHEHSLSSSASGSRTERQARYEAGRRISPEYRYRMKAMSHRYAEGQRVLNLPFLVSRVIWGTPVPDEEAVAKVVAERLSRCPRTLAHMGPGVEKRPRQVIGVLQTLLDPYEFMPGNWRAKLRAAETWFIAAERCTPKQRREGNKTRIRISEAYFLARDQRLTRVEIAERMGIHPSAISHWLRHKPDNPVVKLLADELRAAKK